MGRATEEVRELGQRGCQVSSAWRDVPRVRSRDGKASGDILLPRVPRSMRALQVAGFYNNLLVRVPINISLIVDLCYCL